MAVAVEGFPPPTMPSRVMVRSYGAYPDAAEAVDRLAREEIPADRVTIVARGLAWAEDITPGRAVRDATLAGTALGAVVGLALWALGWAAADIGPFLMAAVGGVLGLLAGAAAGYGSHVLTREDPDVPATGRVDVAHYDILVDEDVAGDARSLLS